MDANVFYSEIWGSRDIAAAVGVTRIKRMTSEYSFPRDATTLIPESDWFKVATKGGELFDIHNFAPVTKEDGERFIIKKKVPEIAHDLDQGKISDDLAQEYKEQGIRLQEAEVSVDELSEKWSIKGMIQGTQMKDVKYVIKKTHGNLHVLKALDTTDLREGKVPDVLFRTFENKNIQLEEPTVEIESIRQWLIVTRDRKFIVEKPRDEDKLHVYEHYLKREYRNHLTQTDKDYISKYKQFKNPESDKTGKVESKFGKAGESYELFPLEDMKELYARLKIEDFEESKRETMEWLTKHQRCFWGENAGLDEVKIGDPAFRKMREWPHKTDEKRDVWLHPASTNPDDIFKMWLFPRWASGVGLNYESGDWIGRFGIQKAGRKLLPYSTLELYVDYRFNDNALHNLGFTYNFFRGRHQGWYGGLAWGGIQEKNNRGVKLDHLAVSAGFVPIAWDINAIPVVGKYLPHTQLTFRAGLRSEIHKSLELAPIKFQIGVNLMQPIIGPKHPLTY